MMAIRFFGVTLSVLGVLVLLMLSGCAGEDSGSYDYPDFSDINLPTPTPDPDTTPPGPPPPPPDQDTTPPSQETWPQEVVGSWQTNRSSVITLGADGSWEERAVGASSGWRGHLHHRDGDSFYIIADGASVIDSRVTINIISANTINITLHYGDGTVIGLTGSRVGTTPDPEPDPDPDPTDPLPTQWRYLAEETDRTYVGGWIIQNSVSIGGRAYPESYRDSNYPPEGRWVFSDFSSGIMPSRISMTLGVSDDADHDTVWRFEIRRNGQTVTTRDVSLGQTDYVTIDVGGYHNMDIKAWRVTGRQGRALICSPRIHF